MTAPEWTIRQATVGELERLVDLRLAMFHAVGLLDEENRKRTREDCRAYFEATLPSEEFRVWVACALDADEPGIKRGTSSDEIGTCSGEPAASTGLADCVGAGAAGELIASIGLVVHSVPPSPFNRAGREGYIMNLVTLPPWRRRGIGRALLSHVIAVLRAEGVPIASLHAAGDGRKLYEELGFVLKDDLPEMRLRLG